MTEPTHDNRMNPRPITVTLAGQQYEMAHPTYRQAQMIQADLADFYHRFGHLQTDGKTREDANPGELLRADAALKDIVASALNIDPEPLYRDVGPDDISAAIKAIGEASKLNTRHPDAHKKKSGPRKRNRRRGGKQR